MRARPWPLASLSSLFDLRFSVMRRGAESAASVRRGFFFRCVSSSSLASSLMTSFGPPTLMPASSSCSMQPIDRNLEYFREIRDCDFRHACSSAVFVCGSCSNQ